MVINYNHPTSWAWWSNIKIRRAQNADALRLALLERAEDVAPLLAVVLSAPENTPYPFRRLNYEVLQTLHDSAIQLIPYFANHTVLENGKVTYSEISNWTVSTICQYLEISRLHEPTQSAFDLAEWFQQMYDIINLLLYTSESYEYSNSEYGFYNETKFAHVYLIQDGSTFNYWSGTCSWSDSHSEALNEETNPYVTEPFVDRPPRAAELVQSRFSKAEWAYSGAGGDISSNVDAKSFGGGGTGTAPEQCSANKSISRLSFYFRNDSEVTAPAFTVKYTWTASDCSGFGSITIPATKAGEESIIEIYTMPEFTIIPNAPESASKSYSFEIPASDDENLTIYYLIDHSFKFREG